MPLKAIVFDVDGVLADSQAAVSRSFAHTMAKFGFHAPSAEEIDKFQGLHARDWIKNLLPEKEAKDDNLVEKMMHYSFNAYRNVYVPILVHPKAGAESTVQKLAAKYALGIATNNPHATTESILKLFKIREHFKAVVCADDVEKPKPAPDVLLKALQILDCPPSEALYIGDSSSDAQCALACGVRLVIVDNPLARDVKSDYRISDLHGLPKLVGEIEEKVEGNIAASSAPKVDGKLRERKKKF